MQKAITCSCLLFAAFSYGQRVDQLTAEKAARQWIKTIPSSENKPVAHCRMLRNKEGVDICYAADLEQGGFVILSIDDEIEPVVAFSTEGSFIPSEKNPLWDLLKQDMPKRYHHARSGELDAGAMKKRSGLELKQNRLRPREKWSLLTKEASPLMLGDSGPMIHNSFLSLYDIRIPPLIQSKWGQASVNWQPCYNYYTPKQYPAGCMATGLAQLMRYHQYPAAPVGRIGNYISWDGEWNSSLTFLVGGDGLGGAYNWSLMPLVPADGVTTEECRAIGALCFDAGIALSMNYKAEVSSSQADLMTSALLYYFQYSNAMLAPQKAAGYSAEEFQSMVNSNLDAGFPVLLAVASTTELSGHLLIADGYGYLQSAMYHHLNMGWDGQENAWYNLPNMITTYYHHDVIQAIGYNIYPSGTGEIISGRIYDKQGRLLEGVTVSIVHTNGPVYSCVTNEKGIYALRYVSTGQHIITSQKPGYMDAKVVVNVAASSGVNCGNIWGADLCLFELDELGMYGGGSGTEADPYLLSLPIHLRELSLCTDDYDKHFLVTADIDMAGFTFDKALLGSNITNGSFSGVFDGNNHTIRNLTVDTNGIGTDYLGFFGMIAPAGKVRNLILDNVTIRGAVDSYYLGGICGMNKGAISRCGVVGTVYGGPTYATCIGGLVGYNEDFAVVEYSFADANVSAEQQVGGLVGFNDTAAIIQHCYVSGHVISFNDPSFNENIGGIVGFNSGNISYCYSRAFLDPSQGSGSAYMGGICGVHYGGSVSYCRFDRQTSGTLGAFGYDAASDTSVSGVTTADMKKQSTFTTIGWNFTTTWEMSAADSIFAGYPILQWQPEAVEPPSVMNLRLELPSELVEQQMGVFFCYADYADGSSENVSSRVNITLPAVTEESESSRGETGGTTPLSGNSSSNTCMIYNPSIYEEDGETKMRCGSQIITITESVQEKINAAMETTGNDGCVLTTKPVTMDTPLDVTASFGGVTTSLSVLIKNRVVQFAGGDGTASSPYLIHSAEQLINAGYYSVYAGRHLKLIADIDLSDYYFNSAVLWPDQNSQAGFQGALFTGCFDGGGYRIIGLQIAAVDATDHYLGLFGCIGPSGQVRNLYVDSAAIFCSSARHVGVLAGRNEGLIEQCKATGMILRPLGSENAGLLCGSNAGLITDCYVIGVADTTEHTGGMVGQNSGTIRRCLAAASLGGHTIAPLCDQGTVESSFWNTDLFEGDPTDVGTGLATTQLQIDTTYRSAGWSFFGTGADNPVWHMPQGTTGYPKLWFERDINEDLAGGYGVEMGDFDVFAAAWGSQEGDSRWNPDCNFMDSGASEGIIDIEDLIELLDHWLVGR